MRCIWNNLINYMISTTKMNIILKLTNHLKMIKMGVFVFQYMAHNSRQWICFRIITLFILLFKNIFPTCKYVDRVACKDGLFSSREYIFHYKVIMSVRTQEIKFFCQWTFTTKYWQIRWQKDNFIFKPSKHATHLWSVHIAS